MAKQPKVQPTTKCQGAPPSAPVLAVGSLSKAAGVAPAPKVAGEAVSKAPGVAPSLVSQVAGGAPSTTAVVSSAPVLAEVAPSEAPAVSEASTADVGTPAEAAASVDSAPMLVGAAKVSMAHSAASVLKEKGAAEPPINNDPMIKRAAAFREKYRVASASGHLPVEQVGFHPCNRDGQPPNGERCVGLCCDILDIGFDVEDANTSGIAVQEKPGATRIHDFNHAACEADEYMAPVLAGCIAYGSLSHSHLHQILRNIRAGMQGSPPSICTASRLYSLEKLHAVDRAFGQAVVIGLKWEVLAWQMEEEEPEACSLIQAAMNAKNGLFLMAHEMQAVSRVATLASVLAEVRLGVKLDEAVRLRLASTMPRYAEDEHYLELFNFIINVGGQGGQFLVDLRDFHKKFVDPAIRRLRLSTFGCLNSIPLEMPHLKIAGAKHTYSVDKKQLKHGFCEGLTPAVIKAALAVKGVATAAEAALKFFHMHCTRACGAKFPDVERVKFFSSVDKGVFGAFLGLRGTDRVKAVNTVGASHFNQLLEIMGDNMPDSLVSPFFASAPAPVPEATAVLQPRIIDFVDGVPVTRQDVKEGQPPAEDFLWNKFMDTSDVASMLLEEQHRSLVFGAIHRPSLKMIHGVHVLGICSVVFGFVELSFQRIPFSSN